MDASFFSYIQQLELIALFSGYPLLYAVVHVLAGKQTMRNRLQFVPLLPISYAVVGILYLGLQLKQLYPDYSLSHIRASIQQPYWTAWALLSVLFLLPVFRKKPVLSLLHSLPVFFLLCRDLYYHSINAQQDNNVVRNDMKIYTDSLLLQIGTFAFIILVSFLFRKALKSN